MAAHTAARPLTLEDAGGSAEERLTNLFFLFLSSGYLAYFLLLIPVIVAQAGLTAPWWSVMGPAFVFGPPAVMGIAGLRKRLRGHAVQRLRARSCSSSPSPRGPWRGTGD